MQVRYQTWREQPELKDNGVDKWHKLFWPEENIKAGTDIFKKFYVESGNNINTTLYRYNSGSLKIPEKPNEEVLKYINKIMYYYYYIQTLARGNNENSKGFNR
jgi:soluble lytic murein transglycosylase-like protein